MSIEVSIAMITYCHERFIARALDSILMQQFEGEYEVIVGEDCSPDGTANILKEYEAKFEGRLKVFYRTKNLGMTKNILDVLEHCSGKYIAFLEGDDFWTDPLKLKKQVKFLNEHPEYTIISHRHQIVDLQGNKIRSNEEAFSEKVKDYGIDELNHFELPGQTATLLVRNFHDQVQKLKSKMKYFFYIPGDTILAIASMAEGKIGKFNDEMSAYRYYIEENGTNWSSRNEIEAKKNYVRFYVISIGMERFGKKLDIPIDMVEEREKLFYQVYRKIKCEKQRRMIWQLPVMLLLEPKKIRLYQRMKERRGRKKNG